MNEIKRFADKVVCVTGGATGIGKNIVRKFAAHGACVVICDIDEKTAKKLAGEIKQQNMVVETLTIDLSKEGMPQSMVRKIVGQYGKLDILINNAHAGQRTDLLEETEENWDNTMSVSIKAAFFAAQEAIQAMSKTGGGTIINISSVAGVVTCHQSPSYHIAKSAMLHMTRYLATYAGKYGVRTNAVLPGFIIKDENQERYDREDNQRFRETAEFCHPLGKLGKSNDVADVVLFLCSGEASFVTGQCLTVDGGLILEEQSGLVSRFNKTFGQQGGA